MDVSKSVDNSTPLSVKSCLAFVILFVYIYIRALIINHGGSGVTLPAEVRHRTLGTFKCINKSDRNNPYERITHVGSMIPEGGRWKLTQVDAIAGIELGKWSFWVETGGKAKWLPRLSLSVQAATNISKRGTTENSRPIC
jgi:Protein of unknown function (DUF3892)